MLQTLHVASQMIIEFYINPIFHSECPRNDTRLTFGDQMWNVSQALDMQNSQKYHKILCKKRAHRLNHKNQSKAVD